MNMDQVTVGDHVTWVNAYGDKDDWYHAVIRELVPDGPGRTAVVCEAALFPGKVRIFVRRDLISEEGSVVRWICGRFWLVRSWV